MARYIDADKMIDGYSTTFPYDLSYCDDGDLKEWIDNQPTADVVPKSEYEQLVYKLECLLCHVTGSRLSKHTYDLRTMETVATDYINETYNDGFGEGYKECAREIFAEIEDEILGAIKSNVKAIDERQTEINAYEDSFIVRCYGKIDALRGIDGFVEELKEKYNAK